MLEKAFWKNVNVAYSHLVFPDMRMRKWLCQSCCSPCVLSAADLAVLGKSLYLHPFLLQGFAWSKSILALGRMSAAFPSALCRVCSCPPQQCALPLLSELLFPGWEISACCSRYISVPEALKKQRTHSHAEASSLEKWGNQQNSASVRPPSRIISPCAHCVLHDAPECL